MYQYQIAEARERKGWSQEQLGNAIGTSQNQISRYETGKRDVPGRILLAIAEATGVSLSFLLGITDNPFINAKPGPKHYRPVLGRIAAGTAREALEDAREYHEVDSKLWEQHPDGIWLEVSGESMNKVFPNGSLVYVDLNEEVRDGEIGVVFVNGWEATVKRVRYQPNGLILQPESYDPFFSDHVIDKDDPDAPEVKIFGKVVSYTAPAEWRA